jgi:hypothetical protein
MRSIFQPATVNRPASGPGLWLLAPIVVAVLIGFGGRGCSLPSAVVPQPPTGPDLVKAFATNDNRSEAAQHAHTFSCICASIADYLEYDGTRSEPLLKTGVQIDDFRRGLRQTRTRGWSFIAKYPELSKAVEAHLQQELGSGGGPLDAASRAKWISAMRQLQTSAQYAADRG